MHARIGEFCRERELTLAGKISKGYSSEIFLVKNQAGKTFALKAEKEKSTRRDMARKETENLKLANSAGIGPKLADFDLGRKIILMEFIDGITFSEWIFEQGPKKSELKKFIGLLLQQAKKLDEIGLSHGQLAGKGKNILVRGGRPVIVDFEKASQCRRCNNANQIEAMLFRNPHSALAKKVRGILEL